MCCSQCFWLYFRVTEEGFFFFFSLSSFSLFFYRKRTSFSILFFLFNNLKRICEIFLQKRSFPPPPFNSCFLFSNLIFFSSFFHFLLLFLFHFYFPSTCLRLFRLHILFFVFRLRHLCIAVTTFIFKKCYRFIFFNWFRKGFRKDSTQKNKKKKIVSLVKFN